ncbi:MAG: CBS domain-containing protein [Myxococcales bacterium]|nr:CBS domain-containing protein [Myxococcales bacterium]MCB9702942.1 CBS domain-containing protein [Myxococcales bacterium]
MTPVPETIEAELTLAQARERMFQDGIRHLPVVQNGSLVGILSQRDVAILEALPECDMGTCTVAQAMHAQPFTCGPNALVRAVAEEMAAHKYGTAIVVEREHPARVIGVFTTIDALRALAKLAS